MPIFNLGAGVPYKTPVLDASYPADASKTVIESATESATFEVKIAEAGYPVDANRYNASFGSKVANYNYVKYQTFSTSAEDI